MDRKQAMSVISRVSMGAFIACLPFLYYGFVRSSLSLVEATAPRLWPLLPFAIGVGLFFPVNSLANSVFHRAWSFLKTLEHEITHILVALIFLKLPVGIRVTAYAGGHAKYVGFGSTGHTWIALAPYFLPTLPIVIVIGSYMFGFGGPIVMVLLGSATAFHLVTNWQETSLRQTDLQGVGIATSVAILPLMNLISYGIILAFVSGGAPLIYRFIAGGTGFAVEPIKWLFRTLAGGR